MMRKLINWFCKRYGIITLNNLPKVEIHSCDPKFLIGGATKSGSPIITSKEITCIISGCRVGGMDCLR
jgi:hypothetical protein